MPEMNTDGNLIYSDQITESFIHALSSGDNGLNNAPLLLLRIIEEGHWKRRYVERLKKVVEFERFIDYVTADPLPGIGASVDTLRRLCAHNIEARDALELELQGKRGAPAGNANASRTMGVHHSICPDRKRDRAGQHLNRLRKDFPDLHAQVMTGQKTVHQASVEAGIYPERVSINFSSAESAASTIANKSLDFAVELIQALQDKVHEMSDRRQTRPAGRIIRVLDLPVAQRREGR